MLTPLNYDMAGMQHYLYLCSLAVLAGNALALPIADKQVYRRQTRTLS